MKHLFSVRAEDGVSFEMNSWPMGFSWSPVTAQTVTYACLYEMRRLWARGVGAADHNLIPDSLEDVVVIKNQRGDIVAFAIGWLDNILIIAKDSALRDTLVEFLKGVLKEVNIVVKGSQEDKRYQKEAQYAQMVDPRGVMDEGVMENEDNECQGEESRVEVTDNTSSLAGWTFTENKVTYGGIEYVSVDKLVSWKHIEENCVDWKKFLDLDREKATARDIAFLVAPQWLEEFLQNMFSI